jgi:hypothetical protein
MIEITTYHTQEHRNSVLDFPVLAEGNQQWLGDGYYFWQDYEFAKWWGECKKCKKPINGKYYSIYTATLKFNQDDLIDTVFNETDYYNFVKKIEEFSKKFQKKFHSKPSLEAFNDFIEDFGLWNEIKVVRFQDLPENNNLLEVNDYYYKKRIQIRVNDPGIICKFVLHNNFLCI